MAKASRGGRARHHGRRIRRKPDQGWLAGRRLRYRSCPLPRHGAEPASRSRADAGTLAARRADHHYQPAQPCRAGCHGTSHRRGAGRPARDRRGQHLHDRGQAQGRARRCARPAMSCSTARSAAPARRPSEGPVTDASGRTTGRVCACGDCRCVGHWCLRHGGLGLPGRKLYCRALNSCAWRAELLCELGDHCDALVQSDIFIVGGCTPLTISGARNSTPGNWRRPRARCSSTVCASRPALRPSTIASCW